MQALDFECSIGQLFGGNANPSYVGQGLRGHPAIDEHCGYGSDIHSYVDQYIYSLYPVNAPASDGYTAIFGIVHTPLEVFEFVTGHVSRIDVKIGDDVKKKQLIGAEGNHGQVWQGGIQITLAMQKAGDKRGSHRHDQKRPCVKVTRTVSTRNYLQTSHGTYRDQEGYYYEVYDYNNGYNGCVDFMKPLFPRDLAKGASGYDVYLFQKALVLEGLFSPDDCIGVFGPKTLAAASAFQKKHSISPTYGFIGPKTRELLNTQFSQT